MDRDGIILLLKIIVIIELILMFLITNFLSVNDCDSCAFEYNNEKISANEFIDMFFNECINNRKGDLNFYNISIEYESGIIS